MADATPPSAVVVLGDDEMTAGRCGDRDQGVDVDRLDRVQIDRPCPDSSAANSSAAATHSCTVTLAPISVTTSSTGPHYLRAAYQDVSALLYTTG